MQKMLWLTSRNFAFFLLGSEIWFSVEVTHLRASSGKEKFFLIKPSRYYLQLIRDEWKEMAAAHSKITKNETSSYFIHPRFINKFE